jgi:CheY-like chemotaxis protein
MIQPGSRPLVLVVEDFDDARDMYRDYLDFAGFRVETARDGREAIEKARAMDPDLILMDLSLPIMDGWEATRRLKRDPATAHLRVIALTAWVLSDQAKRAREAGCDGFIAKPCLPSDLVSQMAVYLKEPSVSASRRPRTRARRH